MNVNESYHLKVKSWLNWASIVALPNPSANAPLARDTESIGPYDEAQILEGLNNKIKSTKRRCYVILLNTTLFQRLYLDIEGYRRFA